MDISLSGLFGFLLIIHTRLCHSQEFSESDFAQDDTLDEDMDKRGGGRANRGGAGYRPFAFPCNGYDNMPRCLHGGKGPYRTVTKSGRFCVCRCPAKWGGNECRFPMHSGMRKRDQLENEADLKTLFDMDSDENSLSYGSEQSDLLTNAELEDDLLKRSYGPWSFDAVFSADHDVAKRPYPWVVWNENMKRMYQEMLNKGRPKRMYPWMSVYYDESDAPEADSRPKKMIPFAMGYSEGFRDPWKMGSDLVTSQNPKRSSPWAILHKSKRLGPWQLVAKDNKRQVPWQIMASSKRNTPWRIMNMSKRSAPWQILGDAQDKRAPWKILQPQGKRMLPWNILEKDQLKATSGNKR